MSRPKKYSNVLFTVDCSECETPHCEACQLKLKVLDEFSEIVTKLVLKLNKKGA
jgi:hypothetical protein